MSKWLASVQSLEEAKSLEQHLPDILDMKNPAEGALGALSHGNVSNIIEWVNNRCLCSATVGDLPMQAKVIATAITAMAGTGVDFVKVGLFDDEHLEKCIEQLAIDIHNLKTPVIAVLFADQLPKQNLIPILAKAGFKGVMLDTAYKNGKGLLDHLSVDLLADFISEAKQTDLLCGLAGALRLTDIAVLQPLQADYLGFRSALCHQHRRTNGLDPYLASQIQAQVNTAAPKAQPTKILSHGAFD